VINQDKTPYANLSPHLILDAIDNVGFQTSGSLVGLNSFENRVYQVGIEEAPPLIAKFYRPARWTDEAIIEEHQFELELAALEIPVVAPIVSQEKSLHEFASYRFALFPRQGGHALEVENLEQLSWMGRFIGRLHAVGSTKPFVHRMSLNVKTYGTDAYQFLLDNNFFPPALAAAFQDTTQELLAKITQRFADVGNIRQLRIHGDCHASNILWNDSGPHILDLDDCLMGPAVQDLWMLISGNTPDVVNLQMDYILEGYEQFHDFNYTELHLIEALRALRLIHYSAWLAKRWDDPAFPLNFPWFNTQHYWEVQLEDLREQILLLDQSFLHME
jgi:Ser/Thr protein kinase RdoA (MazF antagonist)